MNGGRCAAVQVGCPYARGSCVVIPALLLCMSCNGGGATDGDVPPSDDTASPSHEAGSADGGGQPSGAISGALRVNNLGWRPQDRKVAVLLGHGGLTVELRRVGDGELAGSYDASELADDEDSGDKCSTVDLSDSTTPGDYYLAVPSLGLRSYPFRIAADVYNIAGAAAVKSFYYQRCNHARELPFASDALLDYPGIGGQWVDGECHAGDFAAKAGPGSEDHGPLDLHGGWHDAGDYQKTLWGRGVSEMLFAYEVNPDAWTDGQLNIPESGNGIPDLLDEVRWELDFYVRMQRPDGHFMSSAKGRQDEGGIQSPPSASDEERFYFDCTSPDGDPWSGGGVSLAYATGQGTLSLAHAAIVFGTAGESEISGIYGEAASAGWAWLDDQTLSGEENRVKAVAAAAIHRLDPSLETAADFVESFAWADEEEGLSPARTTPGEMLLSTGAWHVLLNDAVDPGLRATVEAAVGTALVDPAFDEEGAYGGMFGGPGNGWDWVWGSNRSQSLYGANLLMARHTGTLGSHDDGELLALGQKHLHFMLGLNPLNMVYMTNMAAYGAEHSSFQIYHKWFSYSGGNGDEGNADYNGKPVSVDEPLYPYHPDDDQTSKLGPAPGLVPGGPNFDYSGSYDIPNREFPAYAYRDFSMQCDWDGEKCRAVPWEITEPMLAYEGPFVLLASFLMSPP